MFLLKSELTCAFNLTQIFVFLLSIIINPEMF